MAQLDEMRKAYNLLQEQDPNHPKHLKDPRCSTRIQIDPRSINFAKLFVQENGSPVLAFCSISNFATRRPVFDGQDTRGSPQ